MPTPPNRPQRNSSPGFRKRTPSDRPKKEVPTGPSPEEMAARETAHEADLAAKLAAEHGCELTAGQLKVEGSTVRVSYLNEAAGIAIEIYPKKGGLNSGIKRKVTADILKLALLKQHWVATHGDKAVCAIALGDQSSADDLLGKKGPSWMRIAAEKFGVEILAIG